LKQRTRMEEDYSIKFIKIYLFPWIFMKECSVIYF
jgi:hypothetical protein